MIMLLAEMKIRSTIHKNDVKKPFIK